MNEFFKLLDELSFPTENDGAKQLAFIGNQVPQYVRLCSTPDAFNRTLFPTFGIMAASARYREEDEPPLSTDRFVQEYESADEAKRDELCPKVAIGISALLLQLQSFHFDNELSEWIGLSIEETEPIFERYFFANVVKGRTLTNEQLAKLGAKHIGMEQTYLDETRKQWAKHLPDHPEPLEIVAEAAERYIAFVKDRTKSTDHPVMAELTTFFRDGQGGKANEMLAEIGGKTGKDAAEIVWTFRGVLRDENGILCRLFEPLAKLLEWPQSKQRNWYQQVKNLEDLEKARRKRESMRIPK